MAEIPYNTANTLSVKISPGQDKQRPATSSKSLFTFGDFRLEEPNVGFGVIDITASTFSKKAFSTNESLTGGLFDYQEIYNANRSKLNLAPEQPTSYSYFSSFYSKVAQSINNIVDTFPYAILADMLGSGNNIVNISYNAFSNITTFNVDETSLINQGSVIYKSGSSIDNLFNDYTNYSLQLSGQSESEVYPITFYTYSSATQQLYFQLTGNIFSGAGPTYNFPIYIRPSVQKMGQFKQTIDQLDYQILYNGKLSVPTDTNNEFVISSYTWTKNIDGFNPDTSGSGYDDFSEALLRDSRKIDDVKTNIFLRAVVPENLIELDSEDEIFKRLIYVYGDEFDEIKRYIDGIAFAHSVNYNRRNSVPNIFMQRLSTLLGIDLKNTFTNVDFFKYIAGEADSSGNSYQDFNLELWTRIIVNLNFLYKRKGTRDAIMFMFKILGAPDCLINFNEFIYKVTNKIDPISFSAQNSVAEISTSLSGNVDASVGLDGYPDIELNPSIFQAGGIGRGSGQEFIDFYSSSYELKRIADNEKIYTGQSSITSVTESNTRDIINSKEVDIFLDPAQLIECDVKNWYALGYGYWNWGSTGSCVSPYSAITFSGLTVPFEWAIDAASCEIMNPPNMSAMTIVQYMDYLYSTFVDPRNRKVAPHYTFTSFLYINLKKIYMNYMYWGGGQQSNRLMFKQIEKLLEVVERGVNVLGQQFIPATTITKGPATLYRNTLFERQKFVYKPGINDGSEFKKLLPPELAPNIPVQVTTAEVNDIINEVIETNVITTTFKESLSPLIITSDIQSTVPRPIRPNLAPTAINAAIQPVVDLIGYMPLEPNTNIIVFPIQ